MPLYHFKCPSCGLTKRKIISPQEADGIELSCTCGETMERSIKPPTSKIIETLDNGAMVRKVERPADAEQLFRERAHGKKGEI